MTKNKRKTRLIALLSIILLFIISLILVGISRNKIIQTSTNETITSGNVKTKALNAIDELYEKLSNSKTTNLVSEKYLVKNDTISRIRPETTVEEFKSEWENEIVTINKNGKEVQDGIIETGMILKRGEENYKLIVVGDVYQDGKADQIDVNTIIKEIKGTEEISTVEAKELNEQQKLAADITEDKKINKGDIQKIADNIVFGKIDIAPIELVKSPKLEVISGTLGENNWYQTEVQVKVHVENDASKTLKTLYKIEGTTPKELQEIQDNGIITLNGYGAYKIIVYTVDNNEVKSQVTELTIKIDDRQIQPTITYAPQKQGEEKVGQDVVATISFNKEDVVVTNSGNSLTHTFKTNGRFTFEFKDQTGRTGTALAEVTWIGERVGADKQWQYLVLEDGKIQLTRYIGSETQVTVPAEYNGYNVYSIGNPDRGDSAETRYNVLCGTNNSTENNSITKITISNGIEVIEDGAFNGCKGLTGDLVIPNSVTEIGTAAFQLCSAFNGTLTLSNNLKTIGIGAFNGCTGFTGDLTIPNGVTTINAQAFCNTGFNGSLTLPTSLAIIDQRAFYLAKNLKGDLIIPNGTKIIGTQAFAGCTGFNANLKIPSTLKTIDSQAFVTCTGFKTLEFPERFDEPVILGDAAFAQCTSLSGNLIIPEGVEKIGSQTFVQCLGFKGTLTLPNSLQSIGSSAFANCSGFTGNLVIPEGITKIELATFSNCVSFNGTLTIPNSVIEIGNTAFQYCRSLTGELKLPKNLVSIGDMAFNNCNKLSGSLDLPTSLTNLGAKAFQNCTALTGDLIIPSTLKNIGNNAFNPNSFNNKVIIVPQNANSIDISSIYDFSNINEFKVEEGNTNFEVADGILYSKDLKTLYAVPVKKNGSITLQSGLTTIKSGAFSGTGREHSITIPSSVTDIEDGALEELKNLGRTKVTFESGCVYQFNGDDSITKNIN